MDSRAIITVGHVESIKKHTMGTDTSDGSAVPFEDIAANIGSHRRSILSLLDGGEDGSETQLHSQEIRQATGISPGSIRHHLQRLEEDWELIEEVGREDTPGGGSPAKLYALTERGHRYVGSEPVSGATHRPLSPEEIVELQHRVDALEGEVERLRGMESDFDELREDVNQIQSAFGKLQPTIEKIIRKLQAG